MNKTTLAIIGLAASLFACDKATVEPVAKSEIAAKKEIKTKSKKVEVKTEPVVQATSKKVEKKKKHVFPKPIKAGEKLQYGAAFNLKSEPITLSAAIAKGGSKDVQKISGEIASVCKAKGCWFILKHDKSPEVRVKMKDYGFFVPKNADGGKAIVEGVLTKRIVPKEEAQHYADDAVKAGEKAKVITEDQNVFELLVSGVEITKPS